MFNLRMKYVILSIIVIAHPSFGETSQQGDLISENKIIASTWSMHVWKVLGWQYDSPYWTKGNEEKGQIGQIGQTDRERNVRALCLGKEGDFYVFFTLRSFVDPTFPNLFVQNIQKPPLNREGNPFSKTEIESESYIRYGGLSLVFYKDQGGGTFEIKNKVSGITKLDEQNPKSYGRSFWGKHFGDFDTTIDNVTYEHPHEKVPAEKHRSIQKEPKIEIKYLEEHDVALLYVPKSVFSKGDAVSTLGISNPTLSVKLMLEHTKELFGFKFVLIGQETIDLIKNYAPAQNEMQLRGFQKLFTVAGLALGPETLHILKAVDSTLNEVIPDELADARNRIEATKIGWELLEATAIKIVNDERKLTKIKNHLLPTISGLMGRSG